MVVDYNDRVEGAGFGETVDRLQQRLEARPCVPVDGEERDSVASEMTESKASQGAPRCQHGGLQPFQGSRCVTSHRTREAHVCRPVGTVSSGSATISLITHRLLRG